MIWPFRKKIDFMASLGTNCEMAYNLRQTYGLQQTGLLDWMITPLSAIPPLIGSHFDLIGNDFEKQVEHVELAGGRRLHNAHEDWYPATPCFPA